MFTAAAFRQSLSRRCTAIPYIALLTRRIPSLILTQSQVQHTPPTSRTYSTSTSLQHPRPNPPPSPILLLLGLQESPEIKQQLLNLNPTNLTFHPKRNQTTFIDFPSAHTASRAFTHALKTSSRLGVKQIEVVRSKKYNDDRTLMIVGGSNEYDKGRRLKRLFRGFNGNWDLKAKHFRIMREREPYAVAKFANTDDAIHAKEVLAKFVNPGFRRVVFGRVDEDVDEEEG